MAADTHLNISPISSHFHPALIYKFKKHFMSLYQKMAIPMRWERVADGGEPVSVHEFPNITLKNTGIRMPLGIIVLLQLLDSLLKCIFNVHSRRLL